MTYYIQNEKTGLYASNRSNGEHDGLTTDTLEYAREFQSWRSANEFNQNFGPDYVVIEIW